MNFVGRVLRRSALAFSLLFLSQGLAWADSELGSIVEGQVNLGKRTFALPPGKWKVINESEFAATSGVNPVGRIKQQYLVQTDAENKFVAAVNIRTTTNTAFTTG
jgi:hypothetical protein